MHCALSIAAKAASVTERGMGRSHERPAPSKGEIVKSYVTMEQHICCICGRAFDTNAILMNRHLREVFKTSRTAGYGICNDDQRKINDGYIALIVIDPTRSSIESTARKLHDLDGIYRTGEIAYVKRDKWEVIFDEPPPDGPFAVIDDGALALLREQWPVTDLTKGEQPRKQ